MKKIIVGVFLILSALTSKACDICGCGVGSYYLGILPEFNKKFVGLRYQHKTLITHLGVQGQRTAITEDETYQTTELWGGWNIGDRFRVLAFVPYNFNKRESQNGNYEKSGLGDIAVMGYYNVFNNRTTVSEKLLVQSLWFGAGIKAPTGKYKPSDNDLSGSSPNTFQLGTASTDFTLNAVYDIRLMDFGINANLNYKINTANKYQYRYGNKFTSNVLAYYKIKVAKNLTIAPNLGLLYEISEKDTEDVNFKVDVSGGKSISLVTGAEANFKKLSFGANYQNVLSQELAGGRVKVGNRLMVHVSFPF